MVIRNPVKLTVSVNQDLVVVDMSQYIYSFFNLLISDTLFISIELYIYFFLTQFHLDFPGSN